MRSLCVILPYLTTGLCPSPCAVHSAWSIDWSECTALTFFSTKLALLGIYPPVADKLAPKPLQCKILLLMKHRIEAWWSLFGACVSAQHSFSACSAGSIAGLVRGRLLRYTVVCVWCVL